jgi:hypothetical protein
MAKNTSPQPECINGWIEILHFKTDPRHLHLAKPLLRSTESLENFKEEHYDLVGSPIPLCEYHSIFELYQQYAAPVDQEFKIPRPFGEFDAINACMNDAKYGRKVITFILYPKGIHRTVKFRNKSMHHHPDFPHVLVQREVAFNAFFPRKRNITD